MNSEDQTDPTRPGERVQTWWCRDCDEEHTAPVIGGLIAPPLQGTQLKSLSECASEQEEMEYV